MGEGLFRHFRGKRYKHGALAAEEEIEKSVGGFEATIRPRKTRGGEHRRKETIRGILSMDRRRRRRRKMARMRDGRGVSKTIASNPTNEFSSNWSSERHLGVSLSVHVKDLFTSVFNTESILAHVDGQTEAVLSSFSIDAIVDSDGGVPTGGPLHSARLRARPGWVRTPVLPMGNPEVRVIGLDLDALDGLDRVRDIRVVDERAVPGGGGKDTTYEI